MATETKKTRRTRSNTSMSRAKIVEAFDRYDRRLTIVYFDRATGARVMTYSDCGMFDALRDIAGYTSHGERIPRIFLDLPREMTRPATLDVTMTDDYKRYEFRPTHMDIGQR